MVVGYKPFKNSNTNIIYEKIKKGEFTFPDDISLSDECKDLITKILNINPSKRPSLD